VSRAEKQFAEMVQGKTRGWRFSQMKSILEWAGFEITRNVRGSHRTFKNRASGVRVTIPDKGSGQVKPVYVDKLIEAIEKSREEE
jgi:predicted RNA binding protein YcfA (HicA-like mRNA interferase family)